MTESTFPEMVRRIFRQQTTAFKINLSFGFILRNFGGTIGWSRGWRSLHRWSHFRSFVQSPVTEHAFPSIKISTTNGTGDRVVVGFLVYTRQETLDKRRAIPLNIYASHKQKKTIKAQNRNKKIFNFFYHSNVNT
jgi:hypothetical protein